MTTALIAGMVSLVLTIVGIPQFIKFYQRKKIGGQQMHEDVKQHMEKAGTPTMGGTVFIVVSCLVTLLFSLLIGMTNGVSAMLIVVVIYGLIGFLDDFLKIFRKINEGLKPYQKLVLQIAAGLLFYFFHTRELGSDVLNVFGWQVHVGILYAFFIIFWLVGFSNAVNLTDGIDGLASISVAISLVAYGIIAYVQGQYDVLLFICTMIGGLLGFFVFNHKPAKVFMGDVGSLALGAMLATISIWLHQEWTLLLIGLVYVLETASVMIQVAYFKWTKKRTGEGKRIFRMTPLHHHFELGGFSGKGSQWSEWKVDGLFWTAGLLMSLLTLLILYL